MESERPVKSLQEVVDAVGVYPPQAYLFLQEGLTHTVVSAHGPVTDPEANRHVNGRQLSEGLRELAMQKWGMLARVVLARWNITTTLDFGRMVFALLEYDLLQKTNEDSLDDFRNVYDFRSAFDTGYRIPQEPQPPTPTRK